MKTDVKYRFSIVNLSKSDSLYNCGMKPVRESALLTLPAPPKVLYSKIEADRHFVGWTRVGDSIRYYKNDTVQVRVSGNISHLHSTSCPRHNLYSE